MEPRTAAFFDVDHTLLAVNSGARWLRHVWRTEGPPLRRCRRSGGWFAIAGAARPRGRDGAPARDYRGGSVASIEVEVREWFVREISKHVCVEGGRGSPSIARRAT